KEIATTSAPLAPHFEHRIRLPTDSSVAELPHRRASDSGSAVRCAPHLQEIRTRECPSTSFSFLTCGSVRTGYSVPRGDLSVHSLPIDPGYWMWKLLGTSCGSIIRVARPTPTARWRALTVMELPFAPGA